MTVSLNCQFEKALRKQSYWGAADVRSVLSDCKKRIKDSQIDWDEGDENWGRLVHDGKVIVFINALIPLAFLLSIHSNALKEILGDCIVVPVESFSSESFSVNTQLLEQVVGREVSTNLNYDQLSIEDLWWATL